METRLYPSLCQTCCCVYYRMQSAGLGGLKHNTVLIGWPYGWRHDLDKQSCKNFVMAIRQAEAASCALMVLKGIHDFPDNSDKLSGTIDIWWIVRILEPCMIHEYTHVCAALVFGRSYQRDVSNASLALDHR